MFIIVNGIELTRMVQIGVIDLCIGQIGEFRAKRTSVFFFDFTPHVDWIVKLLIFINVKNVI